MRRVARTAVALYALFALAVAAVGPSPSSAVTLVTQVFGQLRFELPLEQPFLQLLEQAVLAEDLLG